jgi:hypothetical protein
VLQSHNNDNGICQKDKEVCDLYDLLKDYENAKKFRWEDQLCYQICFDDYDEEGCGKWEFCPEFLEEAKYKFEHFDEVLEPLQQKYDALSFVS